MQDSNKKDLGYINLMIEWINELNSDLEKFKKAGIALSDEIVLKNLSFNLSLIGEPLNANKLSK